ncbi:hypothetical protein QZH41_001413 [Actinostola sp. cb2023]|nr:hypothetical protein QZH41_001413 [Actinostola sp. cb2023]
MAQKLKWGRYVNSSGGKGRNIPCDLRIEHEVRLLKGRFDNIGKNLTPDNAQKIAKSQKHLSEIVSHFDTQAKTPAQTTGHTTLSSEADIDIMINDLLIADVFSFKNKRSYGNALCSECAGSCTGHYRKPTELIDKALKGEQLQTHSPPSEVLKQIFSDPVDNSTADQAALKTFLPPDKVFNKEYKWLDRVSDELNKESTEDIQDISWAAFHASQQVILKLCTKCGAFAINQGSKRKPPTPRESQSAKHVKTGANGGCENVGCDKIPESETADSSNSEEDTESLKARILHLERELKATLEKLQDLVAENNNLRATVSILEQQKKICDSRLFTVEHFKSDENICYYTGFPNFQTFQAVFKFLNPGENVIRTPTSGFIYDVSESSRLLKKGEGYATDPYVNKSLRPEFVQEKSRGVDK